MQNAVIYARYSSHNQREESIEGQLRECHDFAKRNGLRVIEEYCDRALTGKTDNRPSFQKMIKDAKSHKFSYVLVYKLDRFSRNRYDSAMYRSVLKKHNVRVLSARENISDAPEGILLESMLEGLAEYYSANLSQNIKRGMLENAMKCKFNGSGLPLGYKIGEDKRLEIVPAEAKIVQEIFQNYADGMSSTQIVAWCNEKGYKTKRGKPFAKNSLSKMLSNDKYIGVYRFDTVVVEDGIPPIIDKALFEKVQSMLKRNYTSRARNKAIVDYLLSSKLFCGECGANMVGNGGTAKSGKKHYYYKCNTRVTKKGDCCKSTEPKDVIENIVVKTTVEKVLTDENIELIATKVVELVEKEASDFTMLHHYEDALQDTRKRIKNILDLMEEGIATSTTKDRLLELEATESELIENIEHEKIKIPSIPKEQIIFWLNSFKDGNIDSIEYKRKVIDTLVNKVYVYDTDGGGKRIVITFNTSKNSTAEVTHADITNALGFTYNPLDSTKVCKCEPLIMLNYQVFAFVIEIESVV